MIKKEKTIRSLFLRKLFRLHVVLTVLSLSTYFIVAFFDPGFLSYDLRQKYHALADDAIVIAATVLGAPVQPVVTAVAACDENTGIWGVTLDWADDTNTISYDIDRDNLPLVTGLASSEYVDTNVILNATYAYEVTARGPMGPGFAVALPVSVTTPADCSTTAAVPAVNIVSFDGRNVSAFGGTPHASSRRPIFAGTTNMPNAMMHVSVGSVDSLIADFTANSNGFWEWEPPASLAIGTQSIGVTATDPNNVLRQAAASLRFEITKNYEGNDGTMQEAALGGSGVTQISPHQQSPVSFSLDIENSDNTVLQGQDLRTLLKITAIAEKYAGTSVPIRYSLIDDNGATVFSTTRETLLMNGGEKREVFPVPLYMLVGKYNLQAEIILDRVNVSRTVRFSVTALPMPQLGELGGVTTITSAVLERNLGWFTLLLIILLLLWLMLFIREYGMSLRALRQITERHLAKAGFIRKRKGVVR